MRRRALLACARLAACATVAAAGCDHFQVVDFAGAKIEITLAGARPTAAGHHVELWARDGEQNIVRLVSGASADETTSRTGISASTVAYAVVPAVNLDDPCMIDARGNLLWKPEAQPGCSANPYPGCVDGTERMNQANAVVDRVHQLTDRQPSPLLALVGWDDNSNNRPTVKPDATAAARLQACTSWWQTSPGGAYSGNPLQLTAPVHGQLFGMLDFTSFPPSPPQLLGGIHLVSDYGLRDLRELFLTDTPARVADVDVDEIDCTRHPMTCRGTVLLQGNASAPDRGIYHLKLTSTLAGVSGTAAVLTRLDDDPVQF